MNIKLTINLYKVTIFGRSYLSDWDQHRIHELCFHYSLNTMADLESLWDENDMIDQQPFFLLIPSEEESKLAGIWDRLEQRLPAFEIETVKPFKEEDYR